MVLFGFSRIAGENGVGGSLVVLGLYGGIG